MGPLPLTAKEREWWERECEKLETEDVKKLNKLIDQFNLVVPMMKGQMFHVRWREICEDVLKNGKCNEVEVMMSKEAVKEVKAAGSESGTRTLLQRLAKYFGIKFEEKKIS